ncbi:hypothetical protein Peur_022005 [Populus x canadensis]
MLNSVSETQTTIPTSPTPPTAETTARPGYGTRTGSISMPFWFPPPWALHLTCMTSSFLMGLSAWLVWAEGGFHRNPAALYLYLAQLGLSLAWDPIVFRMAAP